VNPWLVAVTVSMATFMEVLDTSIANVSLPHIAGNLGASLDESIWVLTSYLVSNAIIMPVSGWLSTVLGRKAFYMTCVTLFTISSFCCGIAPSLPMLLLFRVLQGAGGGGLAPSGQAMLADTFPGKYFGQAFAIYGVAIVVAPAIGPTVGGWITDNFSWRWIFFINVPVGLLSLILTHQLVQDSPATAERTKRERSKGFRVDYMGFAFTALAFGALQVVLDKGQEDDWFGSTFITVFAVLAVIGLVGMIVWETMIEKEPIVDLPLLKNSGLSTSMFLMFVMGFILNATTVVLPQFVQDILGYNATNAGLILMPGGLVMMVMFPLSGALVNKVQPKYLMAVGLLIVALAMFMMRGFNTEVAFRNLAIARVIQSIGTPLFYLPLNTIAYGNLPPGKSDNASAMMNLMRNLGGSVGISLATTLIIRRAQFHQERLAVHVTTTFRPFADYMNSVGGFTNRNITGFYHTIQSQAKMLSYIDVFHVFAYGTLLMVGMALLLRRVQRGAKPVMAH
jgi:DHA2 family multidrug resistance protein